MHVKIKPHQTLMCIIQHSSARSGHGDYTWSVVRFAFIGP